MNFFALLVLVSFNIASANDALKVIRYYEAFPHNIKIVTIPKDTYLVKDLDYTASVLDESILREYITAYNNVVKDLPRIQSFQENRPLCRDVKNEHEKQERIKTKMCREKGYQYPLDIGEALGELCINFGKYEQISSFLSNLGRNYLSREIAKKKRDLEFNEKMTISRVVRFPSKTFNALQENFTRSIRFNICGNLSYLNLKTFPGRKKQQWLYSNVPPEIGNVEELMMLMKLYFESLQ